MLDEVARTGDPEGYVKSILDQHGRIMGFGHRVWAEDPIANPQAVAQEVGSPRMEVAEALEEAALAALHERKPDYVIATNVEFYSAVLLDAADVPPELTPAMFACSAWPAGRRTSSSRSRPDGCSGPPIATSARAAVAVRCLSWRQPLRRAHSPSREPNASSPGCERNGPTSWRRPRARTTTERAVAYRAIGQFRFRQKTELLRRGLEDESPACRGSALISLELLSRDHPGLVNEVRPLLHELATHDDNQAVGDSPSSA